MLRIHDLSISAKGEELLSRIELELPKGQALGLTGQSGSGKSTILKSLMGILPEQCQITSGEIWLDNERIDALPARKKRQLNGTTLGFIPQNPMTAFDPRLKIKRQLLEGLRVKLGLHRQAAQQQIEKTLLKLKLADTQRILESYPSELSGGMLQRIAAANLLMMKPSYILADEPTSALDEENSRALLALLEEQKKNSGILLVSHDIRALSCLCEDICVMQGGAILEQGPTDAILRAPQCLWTKRFVKAIKETTDEVWQWTELS